MAGKPEISAATADPIEAARPIRGRPPLAPRTACAQWLRNHGMTVVDLAARMSEIAPQVGLPADAAPRAKTLLDSVNGRHWPHPATILLVRHVTNGEVDLEHWVRDLWAR